MTLLSIVIDIADLTACLFSSDWVKRRCYGVNMNVTKSLAVSSKFSLGKKQPKGMQNYGIHSLTKPVYSIQISKQAKSSNKISFK